MVIDILGVSGRVGTPVPIPNTVVKRSSADGTSHLVHDIRVKGAGESRSMPRILIINSEKKTPFIRGLFVLL